VTRLPVAGTVTFANGEKLPDCSITFVPAEGSSGPSATARLLDGNYHFDRNNGPTAGPHRAIVRRNISKTALMASLRGKGEPSNAPDAPEPKLEWTHMVDIPPKGPYQCDFTLDP